MRKKYSVVILLCLILSVVLSISASAESTEIQIVDGYRMEGSYTDGVGNSISYSYVLPQILGADTPYTREAADQIDSIIHGKVEEELKSMAEGYSLNLLGISYDASVYQDICSVMIRLRYDADCNRYMVYNFRPDGSKAEPEELLQLAGIPSEYFAARMQNIICRWLKFDPESVYSQDLRGPFARTVSPENLNLEVPMYLTQEGILECVIRVYSYAGAESYDHVFHFRPEQGYTDAQILELAVQYGEYLGYGRCDAEAVGSDDADLCIQLVRSSSGDSTYQDMFRVDRETLEGVNSDGWNIDISVS